MKKVLRAAVPADLIVKAFANEGWRFIEGESRVAQQRNSN